MNPMLRYGSQGPQVKTLQAALNVWPQRRSPNLTLDGMFGPRTRGKVVEFQGANRLVPDGIVGPKTWEQLKPLINAIVDLIPPPENEKAAQERIVNAAKIAHNYFGWGAGPVVPGQAPHKIAAARCVNNPDPRANKPVNSCQAQVMGNANPNGVYCCKLVDAKMRGPRQGGDQLRMLFQVAGAGSNTQVIASTISLKAVDSWNPPGGGHKNIHDLNSYDIGQWCGIFCYYVYRTAGIDLGGWVNHGTNVWGGHGEQPKFHRFTNPADAPRGSIGCMGGHGGSNHHFIVIDNKEGLIHSIDGNADDPQQYGIENGVQSVIAQRKRSHWELTQAQSYFLFPRL